MKQINQRQIRGQQIAQSREQINRIDDNTYKVKSQSGLGEYEVISTKLGWYCSCMDHVYRHVKCKHIHAVEFSLEIRTQVKRNVTIQPINTISECLFCKSTNIKKFGVRHNKCGDIQRYICRYCNKTFSLNIGFEKMKHDPKGITTAMQLYFSGESLRNTAKSLKLIGVDVTHQTVYNWIKKYTELMKSYIDKLHPQVGDTWRADEMWIKVKGEIKYMFALMDDETRYWIAEEVADTKFKHDARNLFKMGKEHANKRPSVLITDGLPSYNFAFKREFYTNTKPQTKHIKSIKMNGEPNNNKMERLNNEVRDREKVMRGLKKRDTPIITGYQIFHNYFRPHMALGGLTPSEACGINIKGENKWITLIQNASKIE